MPYRLVGSKIVVKADPLGGDGLDMYAADEHVAHHRRVPKGQDSLIEEHVAELRRPRPDRRRKPTRPPKTTITTPVSMTLSVVPWPHALDVVQRPIEDYVAAAGGAL